MPGSRRSPAGSAASSTLICDDASRDIIVILRHALLVLVRVQLLQVQSRAESRGDHSSALCWACGSQCVAHLFLCDSYQFTSYAQLLSTSTSRYPAITKLINLAAMCNVQWQCATRVAEYRIPAKPWDVVSATRRSSGVVPRACVRVYARVLVPPNIFTYTYIHIYSIN